MKKLLQELMEENHALKERWEKLKEWVNTRYNDYRFEGHMQKQLEHLTTHAKKCQTWQK